MRDDMHSNGVELLKDPTLPRRFCPEKSREAGLPAVLKDEIPVHMARRSCRCLFCSSARALNTLEANGTRLARADSMSDRPLHRRLVSERALLVQAFLRQSFA